MGRTRTSGITSGKDGSKVVNKIHQGQRLFARLGKVSQVEAEQWLHQEIERRRREAERATNRRPLFAVCAARYLTESAQKPCAEVLAYHIRMVLPFIGHLEVRQVHDGTLEMFKAARYKDQVTGTTINRSLEVVRTILNRAARVYRDETGQPWLDQAPPILTMEAENRRLPYPLSWSEQDRLFPELPAHLQQMALFAINTGLRDENVCGLRWEWEIPVPEVGRSVFVIPPVDHKTGKRTKRAYVAILNDVAWSVIASQRGRHPEWVFPWRGHRIGTMNNSGWQAARDRVGLAHFRVHDLRHTFATRLRAAEVAKEDRSALLGHVTTSMPEHYAAADVERLVELANRAIKRHEIQTVLKVAYG